MSIATLKKVSICGLIKEKEKVLDELQELGCLHLVSLREPLAEPEKAAPEHPEDAYKALKYLSSCPVKRHQIREAKDFDMTALVEKILRIQQSIRDTSDRCDFLAARIRAVEPWGDFQLPRKGELAGYKLWFYIVPLGKLPSLPRNDLVWQVVHRNHRVAHVVVVAKQEPAPDAMPVARTHTGSTSLSELRQMFNESQLQLEDLRAERESLTRWIFLMTRNLANAENKAGLLHAAEKTLDTGEVFAVQGWLPVQRLQQVVDYADAQDMAVLAEDPLPTETPPTLLENPEPLAAGEDLVSFYQTPSYWEWDPAIPVFFSFALFFAMIISDAGYAGLFGILLLAYWHRLGKSPTGLRMRLLAAALVSSSVVWGVMVGSYFGASPSVSSLPGHLKILDVNDFDTMMRLSVCVGVLHLSFANVQQAMNLRSKGLASLVPVGWIMIMFGALLVWFDQSLQQPQQWLLPAGKANLGLGLAAVFLFSSRAVKKPVDFILRILDGLKGLSNITKIFGDVLSYLRLFALGLASASLAITFNNLAMQAKAIEGPGLLYSLLILIIGHCLNILLSLMSAVVHGMRLNCIEFFNWGLSEEGYPFKSFSKKEIRE